MCGIAGFIPFKTTGSDILENMGQRMVAALHHRGPDQQAYWIDQNAKILMAHTRLSIQDLSDAGSQPMVSADKRYCLVFNGEIYNFRELKADYNLVTQGQSDTEVLLALIESIGFTKTVPLLKGMFAFALYDHAQGMLHIARDPIGKKPLYMGWGTQGFYFASELKSVFACGEKRPTVNTDILDLYLRWRYVPDPYCIYTGFWKLPPAHYVSVSLSKLNQPFDVLEDIKEFWSFDQCARQDNKIISNQDAVGQLDDILNQAVEKRMVSDVPLGMFLSGGIDSTLVAAMMQKQSDQPIKTLTISFDEKKYNEAPIALKTANILGAEHIELNLTAQDAMNIVPDIAGIFDEPFADPSALPTYTICKLAKTKMSVALSGDGGDESFGGYSWYGRAEQLEFLFKIPKEVRGIVSKIFALYPTAQAKKIASMIGAKNWDDLYPKLMTYWDAIQGVKNKNYLQTPYDRTALMDWNKSNVERLMAFDARMFLAGDVLTKVDRCSMAHALEIRSPLLDQNVIEYAWSLPLKMKRKQGQGKWILRELLKQYYPDYDFNQPKQGFSIPHGRWLKNELRGWAEDLFDPNKIALVDSAIITPYWNKHKENKGDYGHYLWTHAMLQSWHRHQVGHDVAPKMKDVS